MAQKTTGIYQLTPIPALYATFQRMLGGDRARRAGSLPTISVPNQANACLILDAARVPFCPYLGEVNYVGIDLNPEQSLAQARANSWRSRHLPFRGFRLAAGGSEKYVRPRPLPRHSASPR